MLLHLKFESYLLIFFIFFIAVIIHETGHFIAANMVRLPIEIFSIGCGPKLFSWKINATEYRLSLLPGGYVVLGVKGLDFFRIAFFRRLIFYSGGILANLFMAILALTVLNKRGQVFSLGSFHALPLFILNHSERFMGATSDINRFFTNNTLNIPVFTLFINMVMTVINLLPLKDFDGGKIVFSFLDRYFPKTLRPYLYFSLIGTVLFVGGTIYVFIMFIVNRIGT